MASAKDIVIKPISSTDANRLCKLWHYSGKVVNNSKLHFGVFLGEKCCGVMQFGPPFRKRQTLPLVKGTPWNGMLELNRMAFSEELPRNSESRAIAVACKIIKKELPVVKWVLSFADASQCGDGTIYRAAGFALTGIKKNASMRKMPDGSVIAAMTYSKGKHILKNGKASAPKEAVPIEGFQIRYIKFLDESWRKFLTVRELPYSYLEKYGAKMYKGKRVTSIDSDAVVHQTTEGGASPTVTLQKIGAGL